MELIVDGNKVFAATGGKTFDRQKPTVIFLHGAGFDRTAWLLQSRWFAHHGRSVLAVDLPGHGRSEGSPLASVADMADWTCRLIDEAGVSRPALVGHSLGALVALETAARRPDGVRALGLLGVAVEMPVHPEMLESAAANTGKVRELMTFWGLGRPMQQGTAPMPGLWLTRSSLALLGAARPGVIHRDLAACNSYAGALEAARRVTCPTAFVLGDSDLMTPPAKARPLIDAIGDKRVTILPQCGHFMMSEQPDRTLAALQAVL